MRDVTVLLHNLAESAPVQRIHDLLARWEI